jgi:hypothetical protein
MKIRPVVVKLFLRRKGLTDGRTDGHDEVNRRFCNLRKRQKTNQSMLYSEIITVCFQIHTKHINTLCGQNVELLKVKLAVHIVTTVRYI